MCTCHFSHMIQNCFVQDCKKKWLHKDHVDFYPFSLAQNNSLLISGIQKRDSHEYSYSSHAFPCQTSTYAY